MSDLHVPFLERTRACPCDSKQQVSRWFSSSRETSPGSPGWRAELQEERARRLSDGSSWGRWGLEGHEGATITALAVAVAEQEVQPEVPGRL